MDQHIYSDPGGPNKQGNDGLSVTCCKFSYYSQFIVFISDEQEKQAARLSSQLSLSLSLIQGVALNHLASKDFLGRKYALEVRGL